MENVEIKKVRFLHWEAVIPQGRSVYFLPAYTKRGAIKLAEKFKEEQT